MTCIHRRNIRRLNACHTIATARTLFNTTVIAMASALPALQGNAAPTGGVVTAGAGSISQQGTATTITQAESQTQQPARMVINWNSFSSAPGESIVFKQPNAAAIALNRVTGASPSQLMGSLSANGQVFILNPNGVLFGAGSQVNAAGMLASTLGMDTAQFMAGNYVLQGSNSAKVVNQGMLKVKDGGYIALVGPAVINDGSLSASKGDAVLAAGDKVTLKIEGGSLLGYSMDLGSANALVDNSVSGIISANGGRVLLEARAADGLSKAVVNHTGLIEAQTLNGSEGSIRLIGDRNVGKLQMSGTLDASAPGGGNAGFVETSAAYVKIADSAKVTTMAAGGNYGTWLIDPIDFEITAGAGGETASSIGAKNLATSLDKGNVTIGTRTNDPGTGKGDITVNAEVDWSGTGRLTLQAYRNIVFNASLNGGSVALLYGQATANGAGSDFYFNNDATISLKDVGGKFTTRKGSDPVKEYTIVRNVGSEDPNDPSSLQGINLTNSGKNYALGADIDASMTQNWAKGAGFSPLPSLLGTFEGLGHQISGLFINRPQTSSVGLFSTVALSGGIRNVALSNANIAGQDTVGGVTGENSGSIIRSSTSGTIKGDNFVGGVVGYNNSVVTESFSSADASGGSLVGGLVGFNQGIISKSFTSGVVSATRGLSGGLVGQNANAVDDSYSQAVVKANNNFGTGGLIGLGSKGSSTTNSFATGQISGAGTSGGLFAFSDGKVVNSYWNTDVDGGTGLSKSAAGEGRTGAQLRQAATFTNWDMATTGGTEKTWRIYENNSMPLLRSLLSPMVLAPQSKVYSGTAQQGPAVPSANGRAGSAASGRDVGTFLPYSSSQQGYDISGGELIITPLGLVFSSSSTDKVYDGTTNARVSLAGNQIRGDNLFVTPTASFDDKNVGNGKTVTVSDVKLGGTDAGNYTYVLTNPTTANITPLGLVFSSSGTDKVYDGTANARVALAGNQIRGDSLFVTPTASFDDKNVGNGKTVTVTDVKLSGTDAGNYTYVSTNPTKANITPLGLVFSSIGADKVYDGKADARVTLTGNQIAADNLIITPTASFDDKNVGNGKTVTVTDVKLSGSDAGNYAYVLRSTTKANITPLGLVFSSAGADKVYDGKSDAKVTLTGNQIASDNLIITPTASFDDKNVGNGKTVTVTDVKLSGTDGRNYAYLLTRPAKANITPLGLVFSPVGVDKVYDGTANANVSLAGNQIASDNLIVTPTASFGDKTIGDKKTVAVTNINLAGDDAKNYTYLLPATTTASITPRPLGITATAADKVYDGGTAALALLRDNRIAGDLLTTSAVASFSDKNAGAGKNVTVSGIAIAGADAGNYRYQPQTLFTTGSITPRPLDISATATDKSYDGNTQTAAALRDNRLAGDVLTASYQRADFVDKNGGQNKPVIVSGIAIAGDDAANYKPNTEATTSASIKPVSLVITANPDVRLASGIPYQGGNGVSYSGLLPGETAAVLDGKLSYGGSAQNAIKEGVYQITPRGLTSANYASTFVDGTLTIQPLPPGAGQAAIYTESGRVALATETDRSSSATWSGLTGNSNDRSSRSATLLTVADCGMRLPENLPLDGCQSTTPSGSTGR